VKESHTQYITDLLSAKLDDLSVLFCAGNET